MTVTAAVPEGSRALREIRTAVRFPPGWNIGKLPSTIRRRIVAFDRPDKVENSSTVNHSGVSTELIVNLSFHQAARTSGIRKSARTMESFNKRLDSRWRGKCARIRHSTTNQAINGKTGSYTRWDVNSKKWT